MDRLAAPGAGRLLTVILVFSVRLNVLKGPITRAVSKATGRELVIEGDLRAVLELGPSALPRRAGQLRQRRLGRSTTTCFRPTPSRPRSACSALLRGRLVVPEVHLEGAALTLEQDAEGRKNWILRQERRGKEEGVARLHPAPDARSTAACCYEDAGARHQPRRRSGDRRRRRRLRRRGHLPGHAGCQRRGARRAGAVAARRQTSPFPLKARGEDRRHHASSVDGTHHRLVGLQRHRHRASSCRGKSMDELYWIVNVALPATSPYTHRRPPGPRRHGDPLRELHRQGRRERPCRAPSRSTPAASARS